MKHLIRDGVWRSGSTAIMSMSCMAKWKRLEPPSSSNPMMVRSGAPSSLLIPMATGLRPTRTPGTAFRWAAGTSARNITTLFLAYGRSFIHLLMKLQLVYDFVNHFSLCSEGDTHPVQVLSVDTAYR